MLQNLNKKKEKGERKKKEKYRQRRRYIKKHHHQHQHQRHHPKHHSHCIIVFSLSHHWTCLYVCVWCNSSNLRSLPSLSLNPKTNSILPSFSFTFSLSHFCYQKTITKTKQEQQRKQKKTTKFLVFLLLPFFLDVWTLLV